MLRLIAFATLTFLVTFSSAAEPAHPKRLLLISQGPDGHPWNTHEYRAGVRILKRLLADAPGIEISTLDAAESPRDLPARIDEADAVVLLVSEGARWIGENPDRLAALRRLAARGGGITALHWALGTKEAAPIDSAKSLFGGCHGGPDRRYAVETLTLSPNPDHPITSGLEPVTIRDEWYYALKFAAEPPVTPLWTAVIDGVPQTLAWAWQRPDGGRSFGFVGLHFHENWADETYRRFITRGILWTAGVEVRGAGRSLKLEFDRKDLTEPRPKEN